MTEHANTLFVGIAASAVCWYRCALPAAALGADWIGVAGDPEHGVARLGGQTGRPVQTVEDFATYDTVVLQQPRHASWLPVIADLQERGITVLYEIDDDMYAMRDAQFHGTAHAFTDDVIRDMERTMRACDGVLCSTRGVAAKVRGVNPRLWICQNGLDLGRYALTRPERDAGTVTIGWAGSTGHRPAILPWLRELLAVMAERPDTRFMCVGAENFAAPLSERFGEDRCIGLPWNFLETYPAAMVSFDIALAPAAPTAFFRAKSDLRWLEASALGIPTIADPHVYPDIRHGETGMHAPTARAARKAMLALVDDAGLRRRIGEAAREHVREHRTSQAVAPQWARALAEARRAVAAAA